MRRCMFPFACCIVAFFYKKFSLKIGREVCDFIIAKRVDVFSEWIVFSGRFLKIHTVHDCQNYLLIAS